MYINRYTYMQNATSLRRWYFSAENEENTDERIKRDSCRYEQPRLHKTHGSGIRTAENPFCELKKMLEEWDDETLPYTPNCPRGLYDLQIRAMADYLAVLEARAAIEGITLSV